MVVTVMRVNRTGGSQDLASLEYDAAAKAFYVRIKRGDVAETEPLSDSVFVDLDASGELLGMEVVLPKDAPQELLSKIEKVAPS